MDLSLLYTKPKRNKIATINLNLFEAHDDETCPISQDSINESNLEFLESVPLSTANKEMKGIVLDCKHKFNGMFLLYHWTRNKNVLCPVCRGGIQGAYINMKCLPSHFRDIFARKVRSERRKDMASERRENEAIAMRMQQEEDYIWLLHFISNNVFFVVQPRYDTDFLTFPCDARISQDGTCTLSTQILLNLTFSITEFKCYIMIKTSLENNNHQFHTRLPESAPFTFDHGNAPILSVCNNSPFCQYTIYYDPKVSHILCTFKTPFFYLKQVADNHLSRTRVL